MSPQKIIIVIEAFFWLTMLATSVAAAIIGIRNLKTLNELKIIVVIPLIEILVDSKYLFLILVKFRVLKVDYELIEKNSIFQTDTSELYNLVEFIAISIFISKTLKNRVNRRIANSLAFTFIAYFSLQTFGHSLKQTDTTLSYALSSIYIITTILLFFKELITDDSYFHKKNDPIFIINSGLFLFASLTFPSSVLYFFISNKEIMISNGVMALNYLSYTIFYSFMIKAFLCQIGSKRLS